MSHSEQQWQLRPGRAEDCAACEYLLLQHFQKEFDRYAIEWHSDRFMSDWAEGYPWVAVQDEQLVGFALWQPSREPRHAWLHSVHVAVRYRLRYIGRALMQQVEREALEQGMEVMELAIFDQNPALYWYQKLGYATVGEPYFQVQLRKKLL